MTPRTRLAILPLILALLTAACYPLVPTPDREAQIDAAVQQTLMVATLNALSTQVAALSLTPTATPIPPTQTPQPTEAATATPAPTGTPSVVTVQVSVPTNCRTGPGRQYDLIGALRVGQTAQVVGKSTALNYWIIQNPNRSGTCWLWGRYATVTGNVAALPETAAPPAPALPKVSVSVDTACRAGPGDAFAVLGTLRAGRTTDVVGRVRDSNFWLVKNPDASGNCWISGQNATFSGNLDALPYVPTPSAPAVTGECSLVSQAVAFGQDYAPNADFDARWTLKNIGSHTWQTDAVDYSYISGTRMHKYNDAYDLPKTVAPGETVEIIVDMIAPGTAGRYTTSWGLVQGSQRLCTFSITIDVVP